MNKNPNVSILALCATIPLCLAPLAAAATSEDANQNWPQWRGPAGNGLVERGNPPLEWSESKNLKWKVEIPGRGHATPAIWGNRIFVMTAVPVENSESAASGTPGAEQAQEPRRGIGGRFGRGGRGGGRGGAPAAEQAFTLLCLDKRTGAVLWQQVPRKDRPHQSIQGANSHSSGSPVTDGEHVFASFGSYGLYCYDLDGKLVWEKDLGKVNVTFGEGSSPTLAGNVLIVLQDNNAESYVYAFDKATGEELWRTPRDERSGWTTPFVLEHDGKSQVVINGSNAVRGYDLKTGKMLWECSGLGSNPVPTVVADRNTLYAMSGHQNGMAMAIELGGSGNLTRSDAVRWKFDRGTPYVPSPLLVEGLLFFCQRTSGIVTCLDAATGVAHYAQERLDGLSGVYASPIAVNGRIYLAGQNGTTVVLAQSKDLRVLASNPLDDGFDASPAVVGNELFLRGYRNLYCIAEQ